MKSSNYRVVWEIDVHAGDKVQAARAALSMMRDPTSLATVFAVVGPDGNSHDVDLGYCPEPEDKT